MEDKKEEGLKTTTIGLMISTAIFFDITQWLLAFLFMDWLVTIFAYMTFWLWFVTRGIKLLTPKRFAIQTGTLLIEIVPLIAALPAITGMVALTIFDTKLKERGISLEAIGKAKTASIKGKNAEAVSRIKPLETSRAQTTTHREPLRSFDSLSKPQSQVFDKAA